MLSVQGEHYSEQTIEKSKFLTYSAHVESEEEARAFLERIRKLHSQATHVCYAFIADKTGNLQRFSDDGEPSGTAGLPILDVLKKTGLFETCVAVVRYFGGIKLGAGGLVRAYSSSASRNLAEAKKCDFQKCRKIALSVEYGEYDALSRFLDRQDCTVEDTSFSDKVSVDVRVKSASAAVFCEKLGDFLLGRVEIFEKEESFYPFPIDI